jgi:hypothetical protein
MKIKKWCIIAIFRQKHVKLNFDKTFGAWNSSDDKGFPTEQI